MLKIDPRFVVDPNLSPVPSKQGAIWVSQVGMKEATVKKQMLFFQVQQTALEQYAHIMGATYEADFAYVFFDTPSDRVYLRLEWNKKPRHALGKHLSKMDETGERGR